MRRAPLLGSLLLVAGCAAGPRPAGPAPLVPLQAVLRPGPDAHALQVTLTAGRADVALRGLQLRGGGFVQVPPTVVEEVVPAGGTRSYALPHGPALCEGRPAPVAVVVTLPGGVVDVAPGGADPLPALRAAGCAR